MNAKAFDAIVIGGVSVGLTLSKVMLLRPEDIVSSEFDESVHTWRLATRAGDIYDASVVISWGEAPSPVGMVPYLGVAVHGLPNRFFVTGPDVSGQQQYIAQCLNAMARTESTRMEVRHSTQRTYTVRYRPDSPVNWRRVRRKIRSAFDLSSLVGIEDQVYDGPAAVQIGDDIHDVRVRLTGHLDPIDGRYHWRGTVFDTLPDENPPQRVRLAVGDRTAEARVAERTPWGSYSVVGVGEPPFTLDEIEFTLPVLS
ncbi:DUF4873 domain-containing protein [Mycolicibacterium moriokaense]|uniref:Uncharacterized protein DUF4873 n=1 Tax=Mycolicibacterium moriokaense TaxID=39691 RepID=A0A318HAV2_9MYCO|nr:DUF4873 domain-containing protein [Mycolicibacterium moriokaense]PXX04324.1 uncharacterized protein DUF4873 [Mycolicibacterium moriokaense]